MLILVIVAVCIYRKGKKKPFKPDFGNGPDTNIQGCFAVNTMKKNTLTENCIAIALDGFIVDNGDSWTITTDEDELVPSTEVAIFLNGKQFALTTEVTFKINGKNFCLSDSKEGSYKEHAALYADGGKSVELIEVDTTMAKKGSLYAELLKLRYIFFDKKNVDFNRPTIFMVPIDGVSVV